MSYLTRTKIAADPTMILRIAACASGEGIPDPLFWVQERMLAFASRAGWAGAWAESSLENPGEDEGAITDTMILEAVQALNTSPA